MQAKIADMYTETNAARAYVYSVAAACDADRTTRIDAAGCICTRQSAPPSMLCKQYRPLAVTDTLMIIQRRVCCEMPSSTK